MEPCPDCGEPLEWDEVDIGVGVICGPAYCSNPSCQFNTRQEEQRTREERWERQEDISGRKGE